MQSSSDDEESDYQDWVSEIEDDSESEDEDDESVGLSEPEEESYDWDDETDWSSKPEDESEDEDNDPSDSDKDSATSSDSDVSSFTFHVDSDYLSELYRSDNDEELFGWRFPSNSKPETGAFVDSDSDFDSDEVRSNDESAGDDKDK